MTVDDVRNRIFRAQHVLRSAGIEDVRVLVEITPPEFVELIADTGILAGVSALPMDSRHGEIELYGAVVRAVNPYTPESRPKFR